MIYADYNSTTPVSHKVAQEMSKYLECWGNPSSSHAIGRSARKLVDQARERVAASLGLNEHSVVFTSGGSEANTNVLLGSFLRDQKGFRLLTSRVEHSSLKDTAQLIQNLGGSVDFAKVNALGELDLPALNSQLDTFKPNLVSLMTANNETGVLFPIPQIIQECKKRNILFHTDAVQAFGKVSPTYFSGADFISISAHKVFGPKGIGALVTRERSLVATHYGGAQELKRRGGTENVSGIIGFGTACTELPSVELIDQIRSIRDAFESRIKESLDGVSLIGSEKNRIANTTNLRIHGIPNEVILGALDLDGIYISAGSACSSGSVAPSHVLLEMGLSKTEAKECIRISFSKVSTLDDADRIAEKIVFHTNRIRERRAHS